MPPDAPIGPDSSEHRQSHYSEHEERDQQQDLAQAIVKAQSGERDWGPIPRPVPFLAGFTITNLITLVTILVGMVVSFTLLKAKLDSNGEVAAKTQQSVDKMDTRLDRVDSHQQRNEFLIDQHSGELEEIEKALNLRVATHSRASDR